MTDTLEVALRREPGRLRERSFDLLVIGAGIHGACVAWDAAMRGLSVALIDQGDFGGATSHNSLKLIHGGIRYLQHLDVRRVRESVRERDFWLGCAPHLVRPLRFIIPAYGYGMRGRLTLGAAERLYNMLRTGCERDVPGRPAVPGGGTLSRDEMLRLLPDLDGRRLTGGVSWTDGQMVDADRVLFEIVQSAAASGAVVCNYVRARTFETRRSRIDGVIAEDVLTGEELSIRASQCVNAAGPWINELLSEQFACAGPQRLAGLSRCVNLVTRRVGGDDLGGCAVGVVSSRSSDSLVDKSSRMFFVTPWRDLSIIGTSHLPYDGRPDELECGRADVEAFLDEINAAYPFRLTPEDVRYCHVGLTPAETGLRRGQVRRARHGAIVDHGRTDNVDGLTSVIGVKYTTARLVAERTVDLILRKLGRDHQPSATGVTPLPGAGRAAQQTLGDVVPDCRPDTAWLSSRSRQAASSEMAVRLGDFVFRRSVLAQAGLCTRGRLEVCAGSMGEVLGWSDERREAEIEAVLARLPRLASPPRAVACGTPVAPQSKAQTDPVPGLREGAI